MKKMPVILGAIWVFLSLVIGLVVVSWPKDAAVNTSALEPVSQSRVEYQKGRAPSTTRETIETSVSIANTEGNEGENFVPTKVRIK